MKSPWILALFELEIEALREGWDANIQAYRYERKGRADAYRRMRLAMQAKTIPKVKP